MSRESEVATRLRADATLVALLPGGIYTAGALGDAGITDPVTTPNAYQGGRLLPCAVVHERAAVPTLQLVSLRDRHASMRQVVEVYVYARLETQILFTALNRVYSLLQGYALSNAWPTVWLGGLGPFPAPELAGARMVRADYEIVSIRRPVSV